MFMLLNTSLNMVKKPNIAKLKAFTVIILRFEFSVTVSEITGRMANRAEVQNLITLFLWLQDGVIPSLK